MTALAKQISETLKTLRKERGWSLDKTALETGVSKAMLGQIERGESSPTIATLWKIASGFNASFSQFIAESTQGTGKPKKVHPSDKNIRVSPIFPYDERLKCEIFVIELLPSCEHQSLPHKQGVIEHVIVTEGKLEVLVNGNWKPLKKGQGLRFDAHQEHGYRNLSPKRATFINFIHYP